MTRALLVVAFAVGCGGPAASTEPVEPVPLPDDEPGTASPSLAADEPTPPPAPELSDAELAPIMERWHATMSSLGELFSAAAGDCPLLAAELDNWVADHEAALVALRADLDTVPPGQWEDVVAARAQAEPELIRPLQRGYMTCSDDPNFRTVMERIDALVY